MMDSYTTAFKYTSLAIVHRLQSLYTFRACSAICYTGNELFASKWPWSIDCQNIETSKASMAMTQGTPESDFSIECFQNYTAPEVFIQGLAGIVDQQDVETMIRAQKQMLQRFEKTNEMLTNCNALSASRLKTVGPEFKKHTQLLIEMKKDLDYIFKKIRLIKTKLSTQYPQEFAEAQRNSLAEEAEEDDDLKKNDAKKEDSKSNEETASTSETIKSDRDKTETNDNASEKRKSFKSSKSSSTDSNTNDFSHSSTESP